MDTIKPKQFKRIFIEISNVCNLACSFCPPSQRHKQVMSVKDFDRVLGKLKGHGDHVYLHVKGEPLNHPDFEDILALCEVHGKRANVTTNGTLLKKHGQTLLSSPAVRLVNISLQSFEGDRQTEAYQAYVRQILAFVKQGLEETDILFELRLWNLDDQGQALDPVGQETLVLIHETLGQQVPITTQNTKGNVGSSKVYISKGYEFQWPSLDNDYVGTTGTCFGLRHQIAILSTGDVVPCCLDGEGVMTLGNILEDNFQDLVTSPRAMAIRTGFENRKVVEILCQHCGYRTQYVHQ